MKECAIPFPFSYLHHRLKTFAADMELRSLSPTPTILACAQTTPPHCISQPISQLHNRFTTHLPTLLNKNGSTIFPNPHTDCNSHAAKHGLEGRIQPHSRTHSPLRNEYKLPSANSDKQRRHSLEHDEHTMSPPPASLEQSRLRQPA